MDISLGIDRNVQDPEITISIGKVRRRPLAPFGARFHVEHAPGSDDMSKAWFSGLTETEAQADIPQRVCVTLCVTTGAVLKRSTPLS